MNRFRSISRALAAPHRGFWATTLAIAAIDAAWIVGAGLAIEPLGFSIAAIIAALLLAAAAFWAVVKPEPTLRGMALSTAALLSFTVSIALLHYLTATLAQPLVDPHLVAAETALGFDWRGHLEFLKTHPVVARGLALAYHSSGPQVALVVIVLSAVRRLGRLWAFVRLFAATLLVVIVVSAFFPAEGPYAFYAPQEIVPSRLETIGGTWHLDPLSRLRRGEVSIISLADIRGLATFPSFHVCLAMITAWALAPIKIVGPLIVLLNLAVIVATVGAGGHYLPDVLAGWILGIGALAYQTLKHRRRSRRTHVSAMASPATSRSWRTRSAVIRAPS